MEIYQQMLDATIAIQQSDGQMLGADANMANMLTNSMVYNSSWWAGSGIDEHGKPEPTGITRYPFGSGNPGELDPSLVTDQSIEGIPIGTPNSTVNYSNVQIVAMISFISFAVTNQGWSGDDLTRAQIINQTWTAESQAMGAKTQVQQTTMKTPSDAFNSQLQLDQQAQSGAVTALGNVLVDLMTSIGNTMGQGVM